MSHWAGVVVLLCAAAAQGYPEFGPSGNQYPPGSGGNSSDPTCTGATCKCIDCHTGPSGCNSGCANYPCWNEFGYYYANFGWTNVENNNYNGDGYAASIEMNSGLSYSPGFAYGAGAAGCDINACTNNGSSTCGNNVVCTSHYNSAGFYYYSFSCASGTSGPVTGGVVYTCSNHCSPNPCSSGYSCSLSGSSPYYTCTESNACLAGTDDCNANATCASLGGSSFSCTCNSGYTGNGVSCSPINECATHDAGDSNPCNNNGDATATCTSNAPGALTYSCTCTTGFTSSGGSTPACVSNCPAGQSTPGAPCGNGICTNTTPGAWSCACSTGYASSGGSNPVCDDYNACTPAAISDCQQSFTGNLCVDQMPPSVTYQCTCGSTFLNGTATPGDNGPACLPKNYCSPDHCGDGGDTGAKCANIGTGTAGYKCTCSNSFWTSGTVAGNVACVDGKEGTQGTPCTVNGTCTNLLLGSGYSCTCNAGYVTTTGMTPTCVLPDACGTGGGNAACAVSQTGNTCSDDAPPSTSYTCACMNAGYVLSTDKMHCAPVVTASASCQGNPCSGNGDGSAICTPATAPLSGYTCQCDVGWVFDGTSCNDLNECLTGGVSPCGEGAICNNAPGGYTCSCPQGLVSSGGPAPTCVSSLSQGVQVTVTPGSCSVATTRGTTTTGPLLLLLAALGLALRRRVRARR